MKISLREKFFAAVIASAAVPVTASATPFELVKVVDPLQTGGTFQGYLVPNESNVFFWAEDSANGPAGQPWGSDGTSVGTTELTLPLGSSAQFFTEQPRFAHKGLVYFVLDNGFDGSQVWRSDGTIAGTIALPNPANYVGASQVLFTGIGGHVLYRAGNDSLTMDGIPADTQALALDIGKARGVIVNGKALFIDDGAVVLTDGTPTGTSAFALPGVTAALDSNGLTQMAAVNGIVYFSGTDGTHGAELWKTDGTLAGTSLVKDIYSGTNSSSPHALTRVQDRLFFVASTMDAGNELWVSDGTNAGTVRVADIRSGPLDSAPHLLTPIGGELYFIANDGIHGNELWRSDGTSAGTMLALGDLNPGTTGAFDTASNSVLQTINHKLLFVANVPGNYGLNVSDGTPAGTSAVDPTFSVSLYQSQFSGLPNSAVAAANGKLFAAGEPTTDSNLNSQLWATDAFATLGKTWCANPEQPIPDNTPAGMTSHFHLPSYGRLSNLRVSVDIGHSYVGDLTISLEHQQTGTQVVLFDQPEDPNDNGGTCPGALLDIVFDDAASVNVQNTCSDGRPAYPFEHSYAPAAPLRGFEGESLEGDWTLTVVDGDHLDVGELHEWCMNFDNDAIFVDGFGH